MNPSTLIFDIETDSANPNEANLKWFGCYSCIDDKYYLYDYTMKEAIMEQISKHKYMVGFNNKGFDQPIIENYFDAEVFKYKIVLDLLECLAPKGMGDFGKYNKNRLAQMNIHLKNHKLKTIIEELKLDNSGTKGDIDYNIFKKNKWLKEEVLEIKKYLKQDILLTKNLLDWYESQFKPLTKLMSSEDIRKLQHLRASMPSLAYSIICHQSNLPADFEENKPEIVTPYSGGHHIDPRWEIATGNIIEVDFASAYPHAMMMCNLYSPEKDGWKGDDYYTVDGEYKKDEMGSIEKTIKQIFHERLKAKIAKDKPKDTSYKLIINSAYGLTGNWKFKSLYNPTTAADCTHIVRTWMKKLAKHLEENGFICLYGFTDSIFVKIPNHLNKQELLFLIDKVTEEFKSHVPFPLETFKMDVEEEIKMVWFVSKNCYLFITNDNEIKYKSTLLNKNTPKVVLKLFEDYMKPKMIKDLDVNFSKKELESEMLKILDDNLDISAQEYNANELSSYKSESSMNAQISKMYGAGRHLLIPNFKGLGVGKAKPSKGKKAVRHCTIEEFRKNNLKPTDIDITKLMKNLKPFMRITPQKKLGDFK